MRARPRRSVQGQGWGQRWWQLQGLGKALPQGLRSNPSALPTDGPIRAPPPHCGPPMPLAFRIPLPMLFGLLKHLRSRRRPRLAPGPARPRAPPSQNPAAWGPPQLRSILHRYASSRGNSCLPLSHGRSSSPSRRCSSPPRRLPIASLYICGPQHQVQRPRPSQGGPPRRLHRPASARGRRRSRVCRPPLPAPLSWPFAPPGAPASS